MVLRSLRVKSQMVYSSSIARETRSKIKYPYCCAAFVIFQNQINALYHWGDVEGIGTNRALQLLIHLDEAMLQGVSVLIHSEKRYSVFLVPFCRLKLIVFRPTP